MKVKALKKFEGIRDAERDIYPKEGDIWEVSEKRAEFLQSKGVVEIIEEEKKIEKEVEKIIDKAYKKDAEEILEVGKKKTTKKNKKK